MKYIKTQKDLNMALDELVAIDPDMSRALCEAGSPTIRKSKVGFPGLFSTLISQQVSVAAAQSIETKVSACLPEVSAEAFLNLSEAEARTNGLSAQKYKYLSGVAAAIISGALDIKALSRASDEEVQRRLLALKGIGPWTANIYLMFGLQRADIFAAGDLALQEGYRRLVGLDTRPDTTAFNLIALKWQPYRSAAAYMLWRYYGHATSRKGDGVAVSS